MDIDQLSNEIIGAALRVHPAPGPGLLESAYGACLAHELARRELRFERQKAIPLHDAGENVEVGFRADFVVESAILRELKAVDGIEPIHLAQVLNYLRLTGLQVGLLMNFNVQIFKSFWASRSSVSRPALRALR